MQKIAQIILRAYLRRNPVHLRLSRFNYFTRYSWLKNVLVDLKPELFPAHSETTIVEPEPEKGSAAQAELLQLVHPLIGKKLKGNQGTYRIDAFLRQQGKSLLFSGMRLESQQSIAIQFYQYSIQQDLLFENLVQQRRMEVWRRQAQFSEQAWLNLADGRLPVFRVARPLEAIADEQEKVVGDRILYSCFLITESQTTLPTLEQVIQEQGPLDPRLVRLLLSQLLQTLDFIHSHKFRFSSGQIQPGLIHGNLSLKTALWQTENSGEPLLFLCDLRLWERLFEPLNQEVLASIQVTPEAVDEELQAIARIGRAMLLGLTQEPMDGAPLQWPGVDEHLEQWLRQRLHQATVQPLEQPPADVSSGLSSEAVSAMPRFVAPLTAAAARERLLQLPPFYEHEDSLQPVDAALPPPSSKRWSKVMLLGGLSAIALLGTLLWSLLPRHQQLAQGESAPLVRYLADVGAVPPGDFIYAAPENGTWRYVTQQSNLMAKGQTLQTVLADTQPDFQLHDLTDFYPLSDPLLLYDSEDAITQVYQGEADFAIVPSPPELLPEMIVETIAYDGLAIVVPFSYANRRKGLPTALKGQLRLEQVQSIYTQPSRMKATLKGSGISDLLPLASNSIEAQYLFEDRVLQTPGLSTDWPSEFVLGPTALLREIIGAFENRGTASIAFAPLSHIRGQCSVYPLAIAAPGKAAVQPLVLDNGQPISPKTDLCARKGAYGPDISAFKTGRYPLSYPIVVVYPKDNRRSIVGKKFVELMRTQEAQELLQDAGLVPIAEF